MFYETNLALTMALSQGRKCGKKITGISTVKTVCSCVILLIDFYGVDIQRIEINREVYVRRNGFAIKYLSDQCCV